MRISFSQNGEDMLVADYLFGRRGETKGIYIDAGCFDPFLYSNTRLLNLFGWKGINIDAGPDVIEKFKHARPLDYNICAALSEKESFMDLVGKPGTPTRKLLASRGDANTSESSQTVETTTLRRILDESPFLDHSVDLLDIDCEMHDLPVLRGFPLERVRPKVIAIEAHSTEELSDISEFLNTFNYRNLASRGPSHLFFGDACAS